MLALTVKLIACLCIMELCAADFEKVLLITPMGTKSHTLSMGIIGNELASKGYNVQLITGHKIPPSSVEILNTQSASEHFSKHFYISPYGEPDPNQFPLMWINCLDVVMKSCQLFYEEEAIEILIRSKPKYSVIVIDSLVQECVLPLAHKLGAPIVFFSANVPDPATNWIRASGASYSYVPHFFVPVTSQLNFLQRIRDLFDHLFYIILHEWWYFPAMEEMSLKYLGPGPSIVDIISNVKATLVAVDGIISSPQPLLPTTIDVGGITARKPRPLPTEFQSLLDTVGDEGFILFCFGTIVDGDYLPSQVYQSYIDAFSRIPQTIIGKGKHVSNLPSNVHLFHWLPQQDLLGHPKIRLFITHGGIHSLYEAAYHGVPVIGMGIFGDQKPNLHKASKQGLVISLLDGNITVESLNEAITTVIQDASYLQTAKRLSVLLQDQPETPLQRAIFTIETIALHGSLPHSHDDGSGLTLFQYFFFDIVMLLVFIFILCCLMVLLGYFVVTSILRRIYTPFLLKKCD